MYFICSKILAPECDILYEIIFYINPPIENFCFFISGEHRSKPKSDQTETGWTRRRNFKMLRPFPLSLNREEWRSPFCNVIRVDISTRSHHHRSGSTRWNRCCTRYHTLRVPVSSTAFPPPLTRFNNLCTAFLKKLENVENCIQECDWIIFVSAMVEKLAGSKWRSQWWYYVFEQSPYTGYT